MPLFHEDAPIVAGRLVHGGREFGRIALMLHLGHAEAGAGAGRLDEQRILQAGFANLRHDRIGVGLDSELSRTRVERDAGRDGNAGGRKQHLV